MFYTKTKDIDTYTTSETPVYVDVVILCEISYSIFGKNEKLFSNINFNYKCIYIDTQPIAIEHRVIVKFHV